MIQTATPIKADRLSRYLKQLSHVRIAVLGDFCLDVYWPTDMAASEISLETGKPTHPVREQRYSLGGAGNVVANLADLGVGTLYACGVIGEDPFGARLKTLLTDRGVHLDGFFTESTDHWQTLTYIKPFVGDDELSRLDIGNFNRLSDDMANRLLSTVEQLIPKVDLVLVNQQVKSGIHTETLQSGLVELISCHPETVFIYDGRHIQGRYDNAWLKINDHEALQRIGIERSADERVTRDEVLDATRQIVDQTGKPLMVTRGGRGCLVCCDGQITDIPGIQVIGSVDTVGAGDSFLAGTAAMVAVGAELEAAAQVGNLAASITITRLGVTGTATPTEIRQAGEAPRYIYEPEKADDPRSARFWDDSQIEIIRTVPSDLKLECAVFDHDGTLSTLRQGWEEVMKPMMIRAILGEQYDDVDEAQYYNVNNRVSRYIDQTTGIQTLAQMQGLVDMVREFGYVPEESILDAAGYKEIYNRDLMKRVSQRMKRLQQGELEVADLTIKGASRVVHHLYDLGIRLYLASGTDEEDVRAEAAALGYAHLFEGRIFGAVGRIDREAKQVVMDRILDDVQGRFITFGDGPVEMRETIRRGGVPVGIASDEIRRYDWDMDKRSRLIRAGASCLIPDFTALKDLCRLLGWPQPDTERNSHEIL
jgi:rfaE bifunctional protein kinase chain/domain